MISNSESQTSGVVSEPTRRNLIQGAAWTVPVLAMAASTPLAAASGCQPTSETLDWSEDFTKVNDFGGSGTIVSSTGDPIGVTVAVTYAAQLAPWTSTLTANASAPGLEISTQLTGANAAGPARNPQYAVITTITFDEPVSNVSLAVWDIDAAQDGTQLVYREWVFVDGATATLGGNLTTDAAGWVYPTVWGDVQPGNVNHKADFSIAGPTTSITVRMNRPMNRTTAHPTPYGAIWIGDIQFDRVCP